MKKFTMVALAAIFVVITLAWSGESEAGKKGYFKKFNLAGLKKGASKSIVWPRKVFKGLSSLKNLASKKIIIRNLVNKGGLLKSLASKKIIIRNLVNKGGLLKNLASKKIIVRNLVSGLKKSIGKPKQGLAALLKTARRGGQKILRAKRIIKIRKGKFRRRR